MTVEWMKIVAILPMLFLQSYGQKCLKLKAFTKDIDFDALGNLDKWWEVKNNLNQIAGETNCLTLRNITSTNFGGTAVAEYVKMDLNITETVVEFKKIKSGVYKKHLQESPTFSLLHQLVVAASGEDVVKRNQLIENHEVSWYTDYKDIIIMQACTESGKTLWSVFTSTPTPSRRYRIKMGRVLKRFRTNVADLQNTVCQLIE